VRLTRLSCTAFRNLDSLELALSPHATIAVGDNGQGKTNLLEALYFLCTLRPLRAQKLSELVQKHFDLRPKGIIQMLDLLRPIYEKTAAYGHFGREEPEFTWEATDKALALKQAA